MRCLWVAKACAFLCCVFVWEGCKKAGETDKTSVQVKRVEEDKQEGKNVVKPETNCRVLMDTSMGSLTVELFEKEAPITTSNFLKYVDEGFYDGTQFHRVIEQFVIQGGGFTASMEQKGTHPPIKNEADNGLKNERGTLSMARTSQPDSATSQFFINVEDNENLDHVPGVPSRFGYAVFAKVVDGMDVVDQIRRVKTTNKGPYQDVPVEPVILRSARRVEEAASKDE